MMPISLKMLRINRFHDCFYIVIVVVLRAGNAEKQKGHGSSFVVFFFSCCCCCCCCFFFLISFRCAKGPCARARSIDDGRGKMGVPAISQVAVQLGAAAAGARARAAAATAASENLFQRPLFRIHRFMLAPTSITISF